MNSTLASSNSPRDDDRITDPARLLVAPSNDTWSDYANPELARELFPGALVDERVRHALSTLDFKQLIHETDDVSQALEVLTPLANDRNVARELMRLAFRLSPPINDNPVTTQIHRILSERISCPDILRMLEIEKKIWEVGLPELKQYRSSIATAKNYFINRQEEPDVAQRIVESILLAQGGSAGHTLALVFRGTSNPLITEPLKKALFEIDGHLGEYFGRTKAAMCLRDTPGLEEQFISRATDENEWTPIRAHALRALKKHPEVLVNALLSPKEIGRQGERSAAAEALSEYLRTSSADERERVVRSLAPLGQGNLLQIAWKMSFNEMRRDQGVVRNILDFVGIWGRAFMDESLTPLREVPLEITVALSSVSDECKRRLASWASESRSSFGLFGGSESSAHRYLRASEVLKAIRSGTPGAILETSGDF